MNQQDKRFSIVCLLDKNPITEESYLCIWYRVVPIGGGTIMKYADRVPTAAKTVAAAMIAESEFVCKSMHALEQKLSEGYALVPWGEPQPMQGEDFAPQGVIK